MYSTPRINVIDKKMVIDESEAKVVREMFTLASLGLTLIISEKL